MSGASGASSLVALLAPVLVALLLSSLALSSTGSSLGSKLDTRTSTLNVTSATSADKPATSNQTTGQDDLGKPPRRQQEADQESEYLIGLGIADITGPSADINLVSLIGQLAAAALGPITGGGLRESSVQLAQQMGYAKPSQDAAGIHLRQFSRSIIIEDKQGARVLYLSIDNGMVSQLLRMRVMDRLRHLYGSSVYNESNVMMSGGFFQYTLYNIPSAGFIAQTLEALVDGIVLSIERADESLQPGKIYFTQGELLDASINRSPTSYANNPPEERQKYQHDTDKTMSLLRLVNRQGQPIGMINWFAVHGTSMNSSNHLISSDNKGYAALLFEEAFNPPGTLPGKGKFVAIFAQANEGDVSPNTQGARCVDSGLPCDLATSTCGNPPRNQKKRQQVSQATSPDWQAMAKKPPQAGMIIQHQQQRNLQQQVQMIRQQPFRRYMSESIWSPLRISGLWRSDRKLTQDDQENPRAMESSLQPQQQIAAVPTDRPKVNEKCIAFGPGKDMFESTKIIAYKQFFKARQLFTDESSQQLIKGPVRFMHEYVDMSSQQVPLYKNLVDLAKRQGRQPVIPIKPNYNTCQAGLGYSFAAGTTDGPGAFDFQQGDTVSTRYWNMVRDFLRRPSLEQIQCHHPKPILLSTGEMDFPYTWHPRVVPTQILMVGQLAIVGLPGEFTTMSGRRVRQIVQDTLDQSSIDFTSYQVSQSSDDGDDDSIAEDDTDEDQDTAEIRLTLAKRRLDETIQRRAAKKQPIKQNVHVVLSGLSNIYTSYITTVEEYEIQRYEGASTLYGPHTLQAYTNQFQRLAKHLADGVPLEPNHLEPPDLTKSLFTLKAGVIYDGTPMGKSFGQVLSDVDTNRTYKCQELVSVSFVAGNPRNDLRQEDSFLYVERYSGNGIWQVMATDSSWETKFIWERMNTILGESKAVIEWELPHECQSGIYRIRHLGSHKNLLQKVTPYQGQSSPFKVSDQSGKNDNLDSELELAISETEAREQRIKLAAHSTLTSKQYQAAMQQQQKRGDHHGLTNSTPESKQSIFMAPLNLISSWLLGRRLRS